MRRVAVVGAGMTHFGELFDLGIKDLVPMAVTEALASVDKGIDRVRHPGRVVRRAHDHDGYPAGVLADSCGLLDIPVTRIENACATGNDAVRNAPSPSPAACSTSRWSIGADKTRETRSARPSGTGWGWLATRPGTTRWG